MNNTTAPRQRCTTPKLKYCNRLSPAEFVSAAADLLSRGWHPVPVGGDTGKVLLVEGVSGYNGIDVEDDSAVRGWAKKYASSEHGLNLATRAPLGVIGIDGDFYDDKHGRESLADAEARWGALPPTWMSTARDDGSGIRWFRLPELCQGHEQWRSVGALPGGDVEVIQRHHRFGVMPPSIHKNGLRYRVLDPGGEECDRLPSPADLPLLPDAWVQGLRKDGGGREERGTEPAGKAVLDGLVDGPMDYQVQAQLSRALEALQHKGSRYDGMNAAVIPMVRFGVFGGVGVPTALRALRDVYVRAVGNARGGEQAAEREFDIAVRDAGLILAGEGVVSTETHRAFEAGGL
jgi:hypothetical protein